MYHLNHYTTHARHNRWGRYSEIPAADLFDLSLPLPLILLLPPLLRREDGGGLLDASQLTGMEDH